MVCNGFCSQVLPEVSHYPCDHPIYGRVVVIQMYNKSLANTFQFFVTEVDVFVRVEVQAYSWGQWEVLIKSHTI